MIGLRLLREEESPGGGRRMLSNFFQFPRNETVSRTTRKISRQSNIGESRNEQTSRIMNRDHQSHGENCQTAIELLPWLLNGSLEASEESSVLEHLASCEACRWELEDIRQAWELLGQHISSMALAEYCLGIESGDWDRGEVERHLAVCPQCRQEAELIGADDVIVDFQTAREKRVEAPVTAPGRHGRRRWVAAASLMAAMVVGGFIGIHLDLGAPLAGVEQIVTGESRVEQGRPIGAYALLQDGFESGSLGSWSLNPNDIAPIHR